MKTIYKTENFLVLVPELPHITRNDGGHLIICPINTIVDRTQLTPRNAIELMRLTVLIGEAMTIGLNNRGIDVGRINYQDNGNWSVLKPEGPSLHIHLYGRAKNAKIQKWGEACYFPHPETGFYDRNEPLNVEDILEIQKQIEILSKQDKYQTSLWA